MGVSNQCIKPVGSVVLDDHDLPMLQILLTPAPPWETVKLVISPENIHISPWKWGFMNIQFSGALFDKVLFHIFFFFKKIF